VQVQYARIGGGRWLADYDQWSCILSGANESSPLHTGKYRYKYTYKLTAQGGWGGVAWEGGRWGGVAIHSSEF
jgi:hypothetical protein